MQLSLEDKQVKGERSLTRRTWENTGKDPLSAAHCSAEAPVSLLHCTLAPAAMSLLRACKRKVCILFCFPQVLMCPRNM